MAINSMPAKDGETYMLRVGTGTFQVETVVSPAALTRGLSGRPSMPKGTGLLFIFPDLKIQSMWMPNMYFPLDIVWLDETLSVVSITRSATPCTSVCPSYTSTYKAQYAIEMNAGDATAFRVGLQLAVIS